MLKQKRKIMSNKKTFKYYLYTPKKQNQNLPVLLFLHGIGERGNNLSDIEKYALPKLIHLSNNHLFDRYA